MKEINESILCAGFGGQGIMLLGKVLAHAGMEAGLSVTWLPSYGAEVRGGTANSDVRISTNVISSPMIEFATVGIILNEPSLEKFESKIKSGGLLILNSSIISKKIDRKDIEVILAPLTDEAMKLGNVRVANMIAAGIYAAKRKVFSKDTLIKVIKKMAKMAGTENRVPINIQAVEKGASLIT